MKNIKKYFNKKDLKTFFKYGYMEFNFKQAFVYYLVFELPFTLIIFTIIYFIKH